MNEIKQSLAIDAAANNTTWKTLIATPGNRKRMRIIVGVAFFSQWSGNGIVVSGCLAQAVSPPC